MPETTLPLPTEVWKCLRCGTTTFSKESYQKHVTSNECLTILAYQCFMQLGMILNSVRSIEQALDRLDDNISELLEKRK